MNKVRAVWRAVAVLAVLTSPQAFGPASATATELGASRAPDDAAVGNVSADLPAAAAAAISAAIGRDQPAYHAVVTEGGLRMSNHDHDLVVEFGRDGMAVEAGAARWGLRLRGYGVDGVIEAARSAAPQAAANRVEYRRGPLTEWYVNGPHGLEQGFTLSSPPADRRTGTSSLTLALTLQGGLYATVDANGRGLSLAQAHGPAMLHYRGLSAYDAAGRELPAHLQLAGADLRIVVDDTDAVYPLTIDPFIRQAKLTASNGSLSDRFGDAIAISGDTVVVGAVGAAYVFVEPPGGWAAGTETARLTASDGTDVDGFGSSVGVSGGTVVVGARWADVGVNDRQGAAYVFVEPLAGWTTATETAKLTASDGAATDEFGSGVAISGDTIVVGASSQFLERPAAYVFVEPDGGWETTTESARLIASDLTDPNADSPGFGASVAVSGDTVVVAAPAADGSDRDQGSAYVFVEPEGGWATSTETAKLTASDRQRNDTFGVSVAVDDDTVVIGAPGFLFGLGAAYLFVEPDGGWVTTTESARLMASDLGEPGVAQDFYGRSVTVDGGTVAISAPSHDLGDNSSRGAVYVFVEPVGGWVTATETAKLTLSDGEPGDGFGTSVGVSDGTLVVGARDLSGLGAAYVFTLDNNPPRVTVVPGGVCGGDHRSGTINLAVTDAEDPPGGLGLTVTSSNPGLLPAGNIGFVGTGAVRTMTVRTVAGRTGTAVVTVTVSDGQATGSTIVTVKATGGGGNTISGTAGADVLLAQGGDDDVFGEAGNDLLCGGLGQDHLEGGPGGDTLRGGGGVNVLVGGDGHDRLDGGNLVDTLRGGAGNDRLAGGDSNDVLAGGQGGDILFGGRGADVLRGEEGNDHLTGGLSGDYFSGGPGTDTATDLNSATGDRQDGTIP